MQIQRLRLTLHGADPGRSAGLARLVAAELAGSPTGRAGRLDTVTVPPVRALRGEPDSVLAGRIAAAVTAALHGAGGAG